MLYRLLTTYYLDSYCCFLNQIHLVTLIVFQSSFRLNVVPLCVCVLQRFCKTKTQNQQLKSISSGNDLGYTSHTCLCIMFLCPSLSMMGIQQRIGCALQTSHMWKQKWASAASGPHKYYNTYCIHPANGQQVLQPKKTFKDFTAKGCVPQTEGGHF